MKTVIRGSAIALFVGAILLYNFGLVDIRIEEIRYLLGSIASQEEVSNTFGIVAKYELIKRRMTGGEDNASTFELEAKIQALTSGNQLERQKSNWAFHLYRVPIRAVVNLTRIVLGKKIVSPKEDDKIINILEIGYFWERNRKYSEAVKIYDDVLKTAGIAPAMKAAVMLHKAFCVSMLGDYKESKSIYEQVISLFPNTEAGVLSWKLLDFIQSMEKGRDDLEKQQMTEMEKARQFYLVMDFRNAIRNYSVFLERTNSPQELEPEARYYKGRSHEELGESEEAMQEYRKVMEIDKTKEWAKKANRRLLMIGQFYDQQKTVADEAKRQLSAYQDQKFFDDMQQYAQLVSQSSLRSELMKDKPQGQQVVRDSVLNSILNIGNLDLTGEKGAAAQQHKLDSIRNVLVEKGAVGQAEMKELQRWKTVTQNPLRRPSVLKTTIDGYSNELKYIYNKRLRAGVKIAGKLFVEITIRADGTIGKASVIQSDIGDTTFEKNVVERIKNWRFQPVADSMGDLSIKYPFEFAEEEEK